MGDLISIIIPVYNSEKFLERCLDSVIGQTYIDLEIILVNDGSTDGSARIIDRFKQLDRRIIAVYQQNQGVSAARNSGLQLCTGKFVGFMDADDEAKPDMYEFLYRNIEKYDADISHCGFELVKSHEIIPFYASGVLKVHDRRDSLRELLSGRYIEPSTCTKLYKKTIIDNIRFSEDIKTNEDLLFNIVAFKKSNTTVFEDQPKYRYISNACSASHSQFTSQKAQQLYDVASRIKNILRDEPIKPDVQRFYALKLLTILQALQRVRLRDSEISSKLRREVRAISYWNYGIRPAVLKLLLTQFPFLYTFIRTVYDFVFFANQKWKDH